MKIETLKCNNCGGDLKIRPQAKFFNCLFCNSSLTIKRTGTVAYTEVLGKIKANTEYLINNSNTLLVEREIARIDREWIIEKEKYKITDEYGSSYPNKTTSIGSIFRAIIKLIFMAFWLYLFSSSSGMKGEIQLGFLLFGIAMIVVIVINTISSISKSENYHDAEEDYLEERKKLLRKLSRRT